MFYQCKHFEIEELVPEEVYNIFRERSWQFFNIVALKSLDGIRDFFDSPVTVNNWKYGGKFSYRGLRQRSCDVGAEYSQHRFGNAFDCDIKGVTAEEARDVIKAHRNDYRFQGITCLEEDVNWLHFDCRNVTDRIKLVYP